MPRFCNVRIPTRFLKASPPQMAAKYLTANYTWDYEITQKEVLVIHSKQLAQTQPNDQKPWPLIRYARQIQTIRLKFSPHSFSPIVQQTAHYCQQTEKSAQWDPNKRMQSEWRTRTHRNSRNKQGKYTRGQITSGQFVYSQVLFINSISVQTENLFFMLLWTNSANFPTQPSLTGFHKQYVVY